MNLTTDRSQGVSIVHVNEARLMYPLLSEFASTITSHSCPFEMKTFWPEMTKSSPSRTALVRIAFRSEAGPVG